MGNSNLRRRPKPLFAGLQGRQGDLGPEEVAHHQRDRLMAATVEACSRHGWPATTVDELVALAGISKTTFYEHFSNRDECFIATFEAVIEQATGQIGEAYRSGKGSRERLTAGMEAYAEIVGAQPAAARLVLIDSLSLGAKALPHRDAAAARFEVMLRQSFDEAGQPGAVDELTIRAWVTGVRRVLYRELRAGHPEEMRDHVGELVDMAMLFADGDSPALRRQPSAHVVQPAVDEIPWEEPPGGKPARATLSQHERIVRGTALAVTERGYGATTIAAICTTAGVSKESFYEHFAGKEEAFFAAYDALAERALAAAAAAFAEQAEWADAIAAGIAALLAHIAANRLYAQLSFFELPTAGEEALNRADTALEAFTAFLNPAAFGASTPLQPPPVVIEALGGGVWAVVQHEIAAGRGADLPQIGPTLTRFVLRPFGVA